MVFWIFGYGSLVWNPGFDYDDKALGYIKNYRRVFDLGKLPLTYICRVALGYIKNYRRVFDLACIDHRGTPEHPARTCTLEEQEGAICWGMAYCVRGSPEKEKAAMAYLEQRECEYDQKSLVNFYKNEEDEHPYLTGVIVFTSTPDKINNKYYLGPAPLEDMAKQIATASGPCGNNREYIFKLEKALYDIGHEDDTIIELANEVRKVLASLGLAVPKDRKFIASKSPMSPRKLVPLPEAIAMDS